MGEAKTFMLFIIYEHRDAIFEVSIMKEPISVCKSGV